MDNGWIKLHRKLLENPLFSFPNYTLTWLYLLLNATHKPIDVMFKGERITLLPGQLTCGTHQIAKKMGVTRSSVDRALGRFEVEHMVEVQTSNKCSLITVKNWQSYQTTEQVVEQQVNNKRTSSEQQVSTKQEAKKLRSEELKKSEPYTATTSVAGDYPKKEVGTGEPKTAKEKRNPDESMAVTEFIAYMEKSGRRDLHLIGEWADTVRPDCQTFGQWQAYMKRCLRAAQGVANFSDAQISNAYRKITNLQKTSDFTPTLETLLKFLTA